MELPKDFEKAYKELPPASDRITADPIWFLYDYQVVIPEAAHSAIDNDDRIVRVDGDDGVTEIILAESNEPVSDEWLVANGYAVWAPRFYGAYMSEEEAYKALEKRPYAFTKPVIYCESLVYSDPALKWFGRALNELRSI